MTPSLEKWPNKAKDPNLTLRHGYSPPDANPVFLYQGDINIIITIIIIIIIVFVVVMVVVIVIIT